MKNNKNIDRLFQEKFKDFETPPDEQTWSNIQAALKVENKERKVIPIGFKYGGIAAAFLLAFWSLNTILKTTDESKNTIVLDHKIAIPLQNKDSIAINFKKDVKKLDLENQSQISSTNDNNAKSIQKKSASLSAQNQSKFNKTKTHYTVYQKAHNTPLEENKIVKGTAQSEVSIAENSSQKNSAFSNLSQNNETVAKDKTDTKIAQSSLEIKEILVPKTVNELEDILKQKEGKKEKLALNTSKNKWEIVPNVAPIYLNTNSNGSAIDPGLAQNNKTADRGFSYGIGVNYALSSKITLRSGINTFSIGYNTNDVTYATGLNTNSLANVNYTSNKGVEIQSQSKFNTLSPVEMDLQKTSTGSINQKMGYYEVPLELSYAVLDKKFGINIIGGVSTLLLKQNEIALVSPQSNFKLGEANNLNSIHFSTNFGLGFKYKFVESFQLNFEPILKYQVNTYSNEIGNFKPIFIGLYSGISYKF